MDKPSELLTDSKRYLFRIKSTVENYERENGNFANTANTTEIKSTIDKLIPVMESEIGVAKKYEFWVEGRNKPVYLLRKLKITEKGNITVNEIIGLFRTKKRADAYRLSLDKEKYIEYRIEEWFVEET